MHSQGKLLESASTWSKRICKGGDMHTSPMKRTPSQKLPEVRGRLNPSASAKKDSCWNVDRLCTTQVHVQRRTHTVVLSSMIKSEGTCKEEHTMVCGHTSFSTSLHAKKKLHYVYWQALSWGNKSEGQRKMQMVTGIVKRIWLQGDSQRRVNTRDHYESTPSQKGCKHVQETSPYQLWIFISAITIPCLMYWQGRLMK